MALIVHSPSAAGRDIIEALGGGDLLSANVSNVADVVIVDAEDSTEAPGRLVIRLGTSGIEELLDDCLRVGAAVGLSREAEQLAVSLRNRMFEAAECVNPFEDGPNVAFLTSVSPLRFAGGWIVQLIERAGGRFPWNPTVARPGTGSASGPQQGERDALPGFEMRGSEFVEYQADVMIFCVEGLDAVSCRELARGTLGLSRFASQPAVRQGRVAFVDGRGTFLRRGPGLASCFEWLTAWLNGRCAAAESVSWVTLEDLDPGESRVML